MQEQVRATNKTQGHAKHRQGQISCSACLKKGLSCDSLRPSCSACSRDTHEADCIYKPVESANRVLQSRLEQLRKTLGRVKAPQSPAADLPSTDPPPQLSDTFSIPVTSTLTPLSTSIFCGSASKAPSDHTIPPTPTSVSPTSPENDQRPSGATTTVTTLGCSAVLWGDTNDNGCQWWKHDKLPPCHKYHLMNIFLRYRMQFGLEVNMTRFVARLTLPPSHPNSIHPALLNAMYLLACVYTTSPDIQALEPQFLAETRQHLPTALAEVDRLFDYLIASVLIARYYNHRTRSLEGHLAIASAARFSVGCGLHKIRSRSYDEMKVELATSLLGPPKDMIELGERINTFWGIFTIDKRTSIAMNLPSAYSDEEIETVWPIPMECYEMEYIQALPCTSLRSLYVPGSGGAALGLTTPINILAKATALIHRSSQLAKQYDPELPATVDFWLKYRATQKAISEFAAALPPFTYKRQTPILSPDSGIFVMAAGHMLATAASLVLHRLFMDEDPESREKGLICVRKIMSILRDLGDIDPRFAYALGLSLLASAEFMKLEFRRLKGDPEPQLLSELKVYRDELLRKIHSLVIWKGRAVDVYMKKLREDLDDTA
ncbi:hypothetical protein BOTBODRAFT_65632 [Botryobasidium botryosum FD-172 SS1]|uniref:Zn(2)-C6 fungal-type domain-containing protein n=1 Tax=Botryobasidium botryosum (strain FD-172 SS1) TaxID=930990 RepID=A0A067MKM5_BOTB1|nr:hypothetical protein BOTBODRAFT_65632 [Botryobasidium botryosum FD-172 SS1]